jgi:hypothetical protein
LNDYKPTDDEVEAGLSRLQNLSAFGTPLSLARRTNMTVEQVMQRPAEEIYMILLYDFEESEYQKRLMKIKEDNEAMMRSLKK